MHPYQWYALPGGDGGFVLWILYFAPYMGHNYGVLPLSPMSDRSNMYCGASKKSNIDFQFF